MTGRWCHVMAHESFEDPEVARALNERFVPVKVDREERPDVDSVYMDAVQALTGRGGWPMSVFLTPDGTPFFGGTYWPKDDRQGMPGFVRVLDAVWKAWTEQRDQVEGSGQRLADHLRQAQAVATTGGPVDAEVARLAAERCVRAWDEVHGGFGGAPKFPQAMTIDFLLAHHLRTGDAGARRAATHSLEQMCRGGISDHVGGGFHRYSVDAIWLVPHFEKMLYDNALLLRAYVHAWLVTGEPRFARVARETATYLLNDLRHKQGGFFSATDADSEGVEGKYFVWTAQEFREVVAAAGEDPDAWARYYGVTEHGNFHEGPPGSNILHEADPATAVPPGHERVRAALAARRAERVPPGLDDKILTSWNALALGALAEAGAALDEPAWVAAARDCAAFLRDELVVDGLLRHTWKEGYGTRPERFCEDVAFLAQALLVLYEADPDPAWFAWASDLVADADANFSDEDTGTYFSTPHDADALLTRPKELWDNATPAASSVMADVHLRLGALTGAAAHAERAERILSAFAARAVEAPTGYGELLRALERRLAGPQEVAVAGSADDEATQALAAVYREAWRPGSVLAIGLAGEQPGVPLLAGREPVGGRPAAYVCRNFACDRPVTEPGELRALLGG